MAEWTVSDTYTLESRTQKELARNTDAEDTEFIIATDVIYAFCEVLDSSGDPVSGVTIDFEQEDPNGSIRGTSTATTDTDGWTPNDGTEDGEAFDPRAPAGTGWIQRAQVQNTHQGNDGSDEQSIQMISPFSANQSPVISASPVSGVDNTQTGETVPSEISHFKPGDRLLVGFALVDSGNRVAPDTDFTPKVMIARFNQSTSKAEILQTDGTFKNKDEAGYSENLFDLNVTAETDGSGDALQYLTNFGTAGQGVTSSNGYQMDTGNWPEDSLIGFIRFQYESKEFDSGTVITVGDRATNENIGHVFDGADFAANIPFK